VSRRISFVAWFSVRSVIQFDDHFEERVVLFQAPDFASAIARAEQENAQYVEALERGEVLDLYQAYELFDDPQDGTEIFSLIRSSSLDAKTYLDTFFDTGSEHEGTVS
jgi:hypothetical protein